MHRVHHRLPERSHQTNRSLLGAFLHTALIPAVIWAISYPTMAASIVGTLLALWVAIRYGRPVVRNARIGGTGPAVPATSEVEP